ncbi:MAG: His-Xaa-Ser system radical SAM maturase HxsB [Candidatus Woesearchaeota archaeon]
MKEKRKNKNYLINFIRIKKIKDKYLLTTDSGAWILLSKKNLDKLFTYNLSKKMYDICKKKGIIISKDNITRLSRLVLERYLHLLVPPSLHIIVLSGRCNLKCVYCHAASSTIKKKDKDLDEKTAKKILEFIFSVPSPTINIEFQGGEPLINKEILKFIVKEAKRMNKKFKKRINFHLVTNLTLMNKKLLKWLLKENVNITTSLDGPKDIHDKNRFYECKCGSTYESVKYWLDFAKNNNLNISALMVGTRESLKDYKKIIDEYVRNGLNTIHLKYALKLGFLKDKKKYENISCDGEKFLDVWKKSMDYLIDLNKKGIEIRERIATVLLKKILQNNDPQYLDIRNPCGIVSGQIVYNYNGDVYCCDEGRSYSLFILGNVKKDNFSSVFFSEEAISLMMASINQNYLCDACVYQPYCGLCPVMSYSETNNIITKLPLSRCKILKGQFDYIFEKMMDPSIMKIFEDWVSGWNKNKCEYLNLTKIIIKNYKFKNIKELCDGKRKNEYIVKTDKSLFCLKSYSLNEKIKKPKRMKILRTVKNEENFVYKKRKFYLYYNI